MSSKPSKTISLSSRLVLAQIIAITFIAIAVASGIYIYTADELKRNYDRDAEQVITYLDGTLGRLLWFYDQDGIARVAETVLQDDLVASVLIRNEKSEMIYSTSDHSTDTSLIKTHSIHFNDQSMGKVEVHYSRANLDKTLERILWTILFVWLLFTICIVLFTHGFVRKFFKGPLASFNRLAEFYRQRPMAPLDNITPYIEFQPIERVVRNLADNVIQQLRQLEDQSHHLESANTAIRESEAKFRGLVETSSDLIWEVNTEGIYTYASPQVEAILGYKPEEIIGKTPFEIMPPEESQRVSEVFGALISKTAPLLDLENINLHRDGHQVILETSGVPFFDQDGNIAGYRGIDRDVTARIQTEKELRESERRLREAQRLAHIGNWDFDLTTNELFWSDEVYRIYGVSPDSFEPTYESFLNAVHPCDRERLEKTYREAVTNNQPFEISHRLVRPDDGRIRYVLGHSKQITDSSGKVVRSVGTVQDVTALELTSRSLRTLSEVNQALVYAVDEQALLDSVCELLVAVGGYRMAWVGYPQQDEAKSVQPVAWHGHESGYIEKLNVTWSHEERGRGPTGQAIRSREPFVIRDTQTDVDFAPWRAAAQTRGYRSVIGLPLMVSGDLLGVLTVYSSDDNAFDDPEVMMLKELAGDLAFGIHTQRLRRALLEHQENLEHLVDTRTAELSAANNRLVELDRLKSMFIASMSHELRTPLNAIISFSSILLQGLLGDLDEQQKDSVWRIQRAGNHLKTLITDVIDISKIEAGRIEVYVENVNTKEIVDEVTDSIRKEAAAKGLSLNIWANSWPTVETDQLRLKQCLLNLLSNAIKYTEKGEIAFTVIEETTSIAFEVRDTGIGISELDIPKLFKAFERLESHLRIHAGGTGLGLYLTKKIATELLHGKIEVESHLNQGSMFRLTIPIKIDSGGSELFEEHQ
ncbi:MAG: PAS domain S-box protein [Candidatus Thiodiazotropha sp. (ex. Lucinisca nassula)]|nr:PAS domain S-box protein [Candidatus Thiodiazotropha sp. (ex. Lucinisca nassula)]